MQYIRHRINQISELKTVDRFHGVEIDLRTDVRGGIHLSHDVWKKGDDFVDWLKAFKESGIQGPVYLNTKEDGLEEKVFELMLEFGIEKFLFLDTALPTLIRWVRENRGASFFARYSAFEPYEYVAKFIGKIEWVWIDCLGGEPVSVEEVTRLKRDFKLCLVSPELVKRPVEEIARFKNLYPLADAVCTKAPEQWAKMCGG